MAKPIVHYVPNKYQSINLGLPAYVFPIDHPGDLVSNEKIIRTSRVIKYDKHTGEFETMNSVYKPVGAE